MLWLALHLPRLSMDLAIRGQADPDQAIVVTEGPVQRRLIHDANAPARTAGIRTGMGLAAAQALVAELQVLPRRLDQEQQAQQHLAACLYRISAEVCLSTDHGIVLEAWASRRLFGGGNQILAEVRQLLAELGYSGQIGLAPTPAGAELAARLGDGVHALSRHALWRLFDQAPLTISALSAAAQQLLDGSGARSLGAVLKLPRDALARRISADDLNYLDRLSGQCADQRRLYQPPAQFARRLELPAPLYTIEQMRFPIRRLLGDLHAFLLARDAGVQSFHIRFAHEDAPASQLHIGLLQVERERQALLDLVEERLGRFQLPAAVTELDLCAAQLLPYQPEQADLLQTAHTQDSPERLLERLRARLGEDAIQSLHRQADHRPERAQAALPAGSPPPGKILPMLAVRRPNWLLATPQPVDASDLRLLSGPERIESGWWDGFDCRRDYYVAEDHHLRRLWVFRTPGQQGGWYLHGVFG
ncbi:MAG: DNA polymerase Y family protein [Ahniella sp.]|nr:DNA polymerase Y family protein [Ahniella sp.]